MKPHPQDRWFNANWRNENRLKWSYGVGWNRKRCIGPKPLGIYGSKGETATQAILIWFLPSEKCRNVIECLIVNGKPTDDPQEIRFEAVTFFKNIFREEHASRPTFDILGFQKLSQEQATLITAKFTHEDIDCAVASCDPFEAPSPDGFYFRFIKSAWEIMKDDVYDTVEEFWKSEMLPRGCNNAFITLIPKCDNPSGFNDSHPISMVDCLYKIITKILARCLQSVMISVIGLISRCF